MQSDKVFKNFIFIFKSSFRGLLFFLLIVNLFACTKNFQKISSKPVILVNEHSMSIKEFSVQLARRLKNYDAIAAKDPQIIRQLKEDILSSFILKSLSLDWAATNKIDVSNEDLESEIENLRAGFPDDLSFRRSLVSDNTSFSEWRDALKTLILQKNISKLLMANLKQITDAEVEKYYQQNKERFKRREQIFIRQILVADEARADAIIKALKGMEFSVLAKKYSTAPEASVGGVVGWVERGAVDFFDSLFKSSLDSVQTIKSSYGIHIVRIEKRLPPSFIPLSNVKQIILQEIRGQREQAEFKSWLDKMIRSSKIQRDNDLINSLRVETKG